MEDTRTLVRWDEAQRVIELTDDPITQTLLRLARMHFLRVQFIEKTARPSTDIDMEYVITVLRGFLGEHEVIRRTLDGEMIGLDDDER